jgi:hypothetical protein
VKGNHGHAIGNSSGEVIEKDSSRTGSGRREPRTMRRLPPFTNPAIRPAHANQRGQWPSEMGRPTLESPAIPAGMATDSPYSNCPV